MRGPNYSIPNYYNAWRLFGCFRPPSLLFPDGVIASIDGVLLKLRNGMLRFGMLRPNYCQFRLADIRVNLYEFIPLFLEDDANIGREESSTLTVARIQWLASEDIDAIY